MPVQVSHPGAYVEELASGVRTITGVATSVTAFLGAAPRGPADAATTITSWAEYERIFGGLAINSPMSYAVRGFYDNGGSVAVIVRLFKDSAAPRSAKFASAAAAPQLEASSPGSWANKLRVRLDQRPAADPSMKAVAERLGVEPGDLFDVTVHDGGGVVERILDVTTKESARRVDRVLAAESQLVRVPEGAALPAQPKVHNGSSGDDDAWTNADKSTAATAAGDSAPLDAAAYTGSATAKTGLYALDRVDLFNLLCISAPRRDSAVPPSVYDQALVYCQSRLAMLIVDPDPAWASDEVVEGVAALGLDGDKARNAAVYYPRVKVADPLLDGQIDSFAPSGMVAGVLARTDTTRGVWKAPAGADASLNGSAGLGDELTDVECGLLNQRGINCLRNLPTFGRVVWGARTMRGADAAADEYKYVPVRRTALFIEDSLRRALQWVVFEPNDEPLWSQIRLDAGAFLHDLFRQGAFQGASPREAYLVKCDQETTTQPDIDLGIVNILVGFAPLKPAEFVIIRLQQLAGQTRA